MVNAHSRASQRGREALTISSTGGQTRRGSAVSGTRDGSCVVQAIPSKTSPRRIMACDRRPRMGCEEQTHGPGPKRLAYVTIPCSPPPLARHAENHMERAYRLPPAACRLLPRPHTC